MPSPFSVQPAPCARTFAVRRAPFVLAAAILLGAGAPGPAAHGAKLQPDALAADLATFWDGPTIATVRVARDADCNVTGPCPEYPLTLKTGGKRLRVAIDTPQRSDTFVVQILDSAGAVAASSTTSNRFNAEALVMNPAAGEWKVRVRPQDVTDASFRLRAKLETVMIPEERPMPATRTALLPNLRTVPPYEFTFIAPANPGNGLYPPDAANPPLEVAGVHPVSCTADEAAPVAAGGAGARKCLRFTSGPMNLGPGIYDMRFRMVEDFVAGTAEVNSSEPLSRIVVGPMEQVIYFSDGTTELRAAGTYSFHPVHGHFHDDYVLSFWLYKVLDAQTGRLERVGEGTKSGFCPADQLFADWWKFYQGGAQPGGDSAFGNCFSPTDGVLGLSLGWGDVYRWQRPGMYVEFDGQGGGRYVVNAIVDENNHVLEGSESDNVSYAYVQVDGDTVTLLERGWGASPWDPGKTVFSGPGPAQRDPDALDAAARRTAKAQGQGLLMGAFGEGALALLLLAALAWRARGRA
jgi:hypothetical protein